MGDSQSADPRARSLLIVPAIDLRGGRCVRLLRGSFDRPTLYDADPAARATRFEEQGARLIHVVDLDAAEGKGRENRAAIARIRSAVSCRLEVGGGVRSEEDARALADLGVERIIVGTVLAKSPDELALWSSELGGSRLVAGIDAQDGLAKTSGWTAETGVADVVLARAAARLGLCGLVYTAISRDGTLEGPDIERTNAVAQAAGLPTILSGGIGSEGDVEAVAIKADPLVVGVIVGRAIYEGKVDLARLLSRHPQLAPI